MAPPPPPGLMDDVIGEILLRLPPEDPACLFRATLVCKRWRSLVLDRAFLREYRAIHRAAVPVLGFFHDEWCESWYNDDIFVPRFVPTTRSTMQAAGSLLPEPAAYAGLTIDGARPKYSCRTLDCRHGRVLLHTTPQLNPSTTTLTVWDPITGDHTSFSPPSDIDPFYDFMGSVLCASDGAVGGDCDHIECSSSTRGKGPFIVVIANVSHGKDNDEAGVAWARVYSSETTAWGASATLAVESDAEPALPTMLAAGAVYFMLEDGRRILRYDLQAAALSVMDAPPQVGDEPNMIFAGELGLGAATVEDYALHLWSWDDGVGEWARVRVIQLDAMLPFSVGSPLTKFDLAGSAQGAGLIFINANDTHRSIFTVELKSGRVTKTGKTRSFGNIFPLMSFCTPGPY